MDWERTLPPYLPPLAQFAVPSFSADPADLPVESAIDHFHSLQATRRRCVIVAKQRLREGVQP